MSIGIEVPLAMGGLLVVSALFSASETALFSIEPIEVERRTKKGHVFGESLAWCLKNPRPLLLTILLTNLAANTFYFSLAGYWASSEGGALAAVVPFVALAGLVFLAEIIPKSVALGMAGPLATLLAPLLKGWVRIVTPVRLPFAWIVQFVASRVRAAARVPRHLSRRELEEIVRLQPSRFGLGTRAAHVVGEVLGLAGIQVREVMVPFVDVEPIAPSAPVAEALETMASRGERWLLVGDQSHTMSHVDAKDLLVADRSRYVGELGRPLPVIPELARLPSLLELFRTEHADRVLAVDEYGVQAGVVGREDLTEAIVGGLVRSEHVSEESAVRLRPNRGWEVTGQLGVHEFEDLFSVRLPIHRNRTIGGLIVEQLETMPVQGQRVSVAGLDIEVLGVTKGRIRRLLVVFPEPEEPEEP